MNQLAIIIPAYKSDFLEETLYSLSVQTCKEFNVYIGDDNSPKNLKDIVNKFSDSLNVYYTRFENNLGSVSLVKQWERCIELSSEEWIWLFSDDDLLYPDCVEVFYAGMNSNSLFYKFNTQLIDSTGREIKDKHSNINKYKPYICSEEFLNKRLVCRGFRSYAVEYIFSRTLYNNYKFIDFPLAWASDDATWAAYSIHNNGLISCLQSTVKWRYSGVNLSSLVIDNKINTSKLDASVEYVVWLKKFISKNDLKISDSIILYWLTIQIASLKYNIDYNAFTQIIRKTYLKVSRYLKIKNYLVIKYFNFRNKLRYKEMMKSNLSKTFKSSI